jgi:hypothetical protein
MGTVYMSAWNVKPYKSVVILKMPGEFESVAMSETDGEGNFTLENIQPGEYELWVLLSTSLEMIPGCQDVAPPEDTWALGIVFEGEKGLTMERGYLSKALMFLENLSADEFPLAGVYSVDPSFIVEAGDNNRIEIILRCL